MKAKQLFQATNGGFKDSGVWHCGECLTVWGDRYKAGAATVQEAAEACCKPSRCPCGKECDRGWLKCDECQNRERWEKTQKAIAAATKVESWDGWVSDPYGGGHSDGYFESLQAMVEWYEDRDEPDEEMPAFAFLTTEIPFSVDLGGAIENALEEHYEDARDDLNGEADMIKAVNEWAAKQTVKSYQEDRTRAIATGLAAKPVTEGG
jgi:hypothetical protein